MKINFAIILFSVLLILPVTANSQTSDNSASNNEQYSRFKINAGFTHWVSDSYLSSKNGKLFGFGIGFRPGASWLEITANHDFSKIRINKSNPDYNTRNGKIIQFTTLSITPQKQFFQNNQSAILSISAGPVMVNLEHEDPVFGTSVGFCFEYLFKAHSINGRMGIYLDVRRNTYNISGKSVSVSSYLKGNDESLEHDIDLILGFVMRI